MQFTLLNDYMDLILSMPMQIANTLYYNPSLALQKLHTLGVATEVFNLWFVMLEQVKRSGQRANFKR